MHGVKRDWFLRARADRLGNRRHSGIRRGVGQRRMGLPHATYICAPIRAGAERQPQAERGRERQDLLVRWRDAACATLGSLRMELGISIVILFVCAR